MDKSSSTSGGARDWIAKRPLLSLAIALVGVGLVTQIVPPPPPPPAPAPVEAARDPTVPVEVGSGLVERWVAPSLRDPSSATYRDVTLRQRRGVPIFCGYVNAKNGFGGYSGFKEFMALGKVVAINDGTALFSRVWNTNCYHTDKDDAVAAKAPHHHAHKAAS